MSEWLTRVISESEAKGMVQGMAQGITQGRSAGIMALAGLVKDGIITAEEAAKRLHLPVADFCREAGITIVQ